jgi:uncharacterized membrane protein YhaH (DUF805 family)
MQDDASLIIQFVPITVIYVIASLIAISRRGDEQTRSEGFRRWRRMHLWIAGAIVAAFIFAYIEWSMPYPTPDLMSLAGHWLVYCLIAACIIAALVGYLKRRAASKQTDDGTKPIAVVRFLRYCFGFFGRFNRTDFWIGYGFATLMMVIPLALFAWSGNDTAATFAGLWAMLWFVSMFAVATKRLHDLDHSILALPLFFAVLLALAFFTRGQARQFEGVLPGIGIIWLGSKRGVKGANRFGADPSPI